MTAETVSNEAQRSDADDSGAHTARSHLLVAAILFALGMIATSIAALQLVVPDLASGFAPMSYGRLAPASRALVTYGWAVVGLLGLSYYALTTITGESVKRRAFASASLVAIAVGAVGGAAGIQFGLSSGISGQESPIWARALIAIGVLLAALSITATARAKGDRLGAAGWYLTAAPILLTATTIVGSIPSPWGIPGPLLSSFTNAGIILFIITASVGLLYFVFGTISGGDINEARPLAALGFWSLVLVWAFMSGTELIYSPAPNWLETISVAFSIGAFIPALVITTDISLMLKGTVDDIGDRASLRYAIVASISLVSATAVNFLLSWPASSSIVQFSTWVLGLDVLIVLGGASFAIFAGHSVLNGGRATEASTHFNWSVIGLIGAAATFLVGGVATGFSWAAGPTSQKFPNWGEGWDISADTVAPFLWVAAIALVIFAVAQIIFLVQLSQTNDERLHTPTGPEAYDLEFAGAPRSITWKRLVRGVVAVWVFAAAFTLALPIADDTDREPSLLADASRNYGPGLSEFNGRSVYISAGCAECHTQVVRPVAADVGLGAVSIAGDYTHENPVLQGAFRFGPDLMHVASRDGFDRDALKAHLQNPRASRSWSIMPSYAYLSETDIDALVSYIETLR